MKSKTTTLLLLAVGTVISHAAVLLENSGYAVNATEVRYTFETDGGNNITVPLQTDDTGNNRIITGINNGGAFLAGPIAPGSTNSIGATNFSYGYLMANTTGMATDNYQITIYVSPLVNYFGYNPPGVIFAADGLELGINGSIEYYASVNGVTLGTQLTAQGDAKGLMIQKKNGEFSFWIANVNTATWVQVGGTSSAVAGNDFSGTHMFVKPGGSEPFWGLVDDFKIQSFIADPFANWMFTNYPTIVSPDNQPGADPENDGIKNLLEYVLQGGNPSVSTTGTLPTLDASGANFVFTYYRRAAATGITQIFEYGSTLSGWTQVAIPGGAGVVVTDQGGGIDKVEITVVKGANTQLFGRLQVVK